MSGCIFCLQPTSAKAILADGGLTDGGASVASRSGRYRDRTRSPQGRVDEHGLPAGRGCGAARLVPAGAGRTAARKLLDGRRSRAVGLVEPGHVTVQWRSARCRTVTVASGEHGWLNYISRVCQPGGAYRKAKYSFAPHCLRLKSL